MNEERKHKKLNIKKIAIVALSVIMIMATFCLSAFADNPLTSKSEYIASAENPTETINTSIENSRTEEHYIVDNETGEPINIQYDNHQSADRIILYLNENYSIELVIGDKPVLAYLYNEDTTNYDLTFNETMKINVEANTSFTAEEQIEAINEAIASVIYDQPTEIKEAFSKYTAKEVTTTPGILSTFLGIGTWIGGAVSTLIGMFYLNGSLTFVGYLAVAALAVSVIFLIVYLISSFLKFRG